MGVPPMSHRSLLAAAAVLLLGGCKTGGATSSAVGAAVMTPLAIGSAAASRAAGNCIAICTAGTACNPATGLCQPLPCRGQCGPEEHCEQTFSEDKCVSGGPTSVETLAKGKKTTVPGIAPATAPQAQPGSPTRVPAAEQQPPQSK